MIHFQRKQNMAIAKSKSKSNSKIRSNPSKELPKRDITSYVTKQMLSGNISILKIPRMELEKTLERYCIDNPSIDVTDIPLVGFCDRNGKDAIGKAVISLAKRYCGPRGSKTAIFSKDGHNVVIFGKSAKEIVSKISIDDDAEVEHLKTKIKVKASFPTKRKLNCFGGERICDHI